MLQPCPGLSMYETPAGDPFVFLHYSADETLTPEKIELLRSKFPSDAFWRREMEGEEDALEGQLVYPEFDPVLHVVPDGRVPSKMTRYMAIDPHPRTPDAMLWIGVDRDSDWWAYRELWPSVAEGLPRQLGDSDSENNYSIRDFCESVAALEGNRLEFHNPTTDHEFAVYEDLPKGERIASRYMDQAGKGFRASDESQPEENYSTRYANYGIACSDPVKSHGIGEDAVHELLKLRHHNLYGVWPRLHIAESLRELQLELRTHRYPSMAPSETRDLRQEGSKRRCHLVDLLRYLSASPGVCFIQGLQS